MKIDLKKPLKNLDGSNAKINEGIDLTIRDLLLQIVLATPDKMMPEDKVTDSLLFLKIQAQKISVDLDTSKEIPRILNKAQELDFINVLTFTQLNQVLNGNENPLKTLNKS